MFYDGSTVVQFWGSTVVLRWFYGGPVLGVYGGSTVVLRWYYGGLLRWFYDGSTVVLRRGLFSECKQFKSVFLTRKVISTDLKFHLGAA